MYEAGPGVAVSEPVFVPRTEDSEGDGFSLRIHMMRTVAQVIC